MNEYEVFRRHMAIKSYFMGKFDYDKYNGMAPISSEVFRKNPAKHFYKKIGKKKFPIDYMVSNLVYDPSLWIGEIMSEHHERAYLKWIGNKQAITARFKSQIKLMDDRFFPSIKPDSSGNVPLFEMFHEGKIDLDILSIIGHIAKAHAAWNEVYYDKVFLNRIEKLYRFVKVDEKKFIEIMRNRFEM